jgi:hypothetical protein
VFNDSVARKELTFERKSSAAFAVGAQVFPIFRVAVSRDSLHGVPFPSLEKPCTAARRLSGEERQ